MKVYLELFFSFMKIGAFTFGGGYAMLPLIQREIVEHKKWATEDEIMDYYAVGQCTPGIIAVNTATFVGYYKKGILGGIFAALGVITPSIIIILCIATVLENFSELDIIQHALMGIRIAVCVLIFNAVTKLFKSGIKDQLTSIIFFIALLLALSKKVQTFYILLVGAILGIGYQMYKARKEGK